MLKPGDILKRAFSKIVAPLRAGMYIMKSSKGVSGTTDAQNYGKKLTDPKNLWRVYLAESWVRACVDVITKATLAEGWDFVPAKGETEETAKEEIAKAHALLDCPNPNDTGDDVLQNISEDLLIFGDSYLEKVPTKATKEAEKKILAEIYNLDAVTMRIKADDHGKVKGYDQKTNKSAKWNPEEIAHFKLSTKGASVHGISPLESLIRPVEADIYAQAYNRAFFMNAARPRGLFIMKNAHSEQVIRNRAYLEAEHKGTDQAYKDMVLEGDIDFKDLQKSPQDIEFLKLRQFVRSEILAVYGVPPAKIAIIETAQLGGGTGDSQDNTFKRETVGPQQRRNEATYNREVLVKGQGITKAVLKFRRSDVSAEKDKADVSEVLSKTHKTYLDAGVMSTNEVREQLGLDPMEIKKQLTNGPQTGKDLPDAVPVRTLNAQNWLDNDPDYLRTRDAILKFFNKQRREVSTRVRQVTVPDQFKKGLDELNEITRLIRDDELTGVLRSNVQETYTTSYKQGGHDAKAAGYGPLPAAFGPQPGDFSDIETRLPILAKDISEQLRSDIRATLSTGIQAGEGANELAERISDVYNQPRTFNVAPVVDDAGNVVRAGHTRTLSNEVWAETTARTETMRAFDNSRLSSFTRMGVRQVNIQLTAGAEEQCIALAADGPYDIDNAWGIIPAHPRCRCAWVPVPRGV